MLFNSLDFFIFIALFFAAWPFVVTHQKSRLLFLTLTSFIFYGWWDWRFIFLIIGSGLLDFYSALGINKYKSRKKLFLLLSILGNVGSLFTFKYIFFATHTINQSLGTLGVTDQFPVLRLTLPIGISFYTFQSMSYTIDVYKGKVEPTRNILQFFSYLALFPQLVAGPIVRAGHLLPQLLDWKKPTHANTWQGLKWIALGFFKKSFIADNIAPAVQRAFDYGETIPCFLTWWIIITMFAVQIYCDFSGYSDIARGLGKWMGFDFPVNFNRPYLAKSFKEFWQRWHISLSLWFRDYVYIPLGGSKGTALMAYRNLWITMLVAGLWHGAAWNFLIWGALNAFYISVERMTRWPEKLNNCGLSYLANPLLIFQVWLGWVFFRSISLDHALEILRTMFNPWDFNLKLINEVPLLSLVALGLVLVHQFLSYFKIDEKIKSSHRYRRYEPALVALMLVISFFFRGTGLEFIYFQF